MALRRLFNVPIHNILATDLLSVLIAAESRWRKNPASQIVPPKTCINYLFELCDVAQSVATTRYAAICLFQKHQYARGTSVSPNNDEEKKRQKLRTLACWMLASKQYDQNARQPVDLKERLGVQEDPRHLLAAELDVLQACSYEVFIGGETVVPFLEIFLAISEHFQLPKKLHLLAYTILELLTLGSWSSNKKRRELSPLLNSSHSVLASAVMASALVAKTGTYKACFTGSHQLLPLVIASEMTGLPYEQVREMVTSILRECSLGPTRNHGNWA